MVVSSKCYQTDNKSLGSLFRLLINDKRELPLYDNILTQRSKLVSPIKVQPDWEQHNSTL